MLQSKERVAERIKKQNQYIYYLKEAHFGSKDRHRLKVNGWRKIYHAKRSWERKKSWGSNIYSKQNRLQNKGLHDPKKKIS